MALKTHPGLVVIDEVQKVPMLLDEVHWLIENRKIRFGLCGSSARKLKRGHANLLGGRALRYELSGLVSSELEDSFDLRRLLNHGYLPTHYQEDKPLPLIRSYVTDYLKEEIAEEGLVRNLPRFARFLEVAALCDTQILNLSKIASDCQVSSPTIREYLQIIVDTLLGSFLESYTRKPKRKVIKSPKFYFFDIGIVNHLSRRGEIEFGSDASGAAFENWVYHELRSYNHYSEKYAPLGYWRLADHQSTEVDFIIGDMEVAIECKASNKIAGHHLKSLYEIKREHPRIRRRLLVCMEPRRRMTDEGIEVVPAREFANELWQGEIFA